MSHMSVQAQAHDGIVCNKYSGTTSSPFFAVLRAVYSVQSCWFLRKLIALLERSVPFGDRLKSSMTITQSVNVDDPVFQIGKRQTKYDYRKRLYFIEKIF